jgi:hypothetical protein
MENIIITKSLKSQLDQVIVHEQVENGVAINNNLNEDQIDQQFVTPRIVSHLKQRHSWIEEKPIGHKMPQVAPIIPHEVQTGEAQKHTNNLQQNSRREECQIENVDS